MNKKQIKDALRIALWSLESETLIKGIAGEDFNKKIDETTDAIFSNLNRRKFVRGMSGDSLRGLVGRRVQVLGEVLSASMATCYVSRSVKGRTSHDSISYCALKIQIAGCEMSAAPIVTSDLINKSLALQGRRVRLLGTVINVPISRRRTRIALFVDAIAESESLIDVLQPSDVIREKAERFIEKNRVSLLNTLTDRLVRRFGIVGSEGKTTAALLPEVALLVAAASPYLGQKCGMPHILVVGDPGGGKSFLLQSLRVLLAYFQEVHGGRMTAPGFTASTVIDRETQTVSTRKGSLPLAHRGAVYLQDVHSIKTNTFDEISHVLSDQMEFGKVVISTSANTVHPAATSVVVDMNMKSRVDKKKEYSAHEDIRWEVQMLSRFDLMLAVEPLEKSEKVVAEMSRKILKSAVDKGSGDDSMIFKTVVALLHEKIPSVDLSEIEADIADKLGNFYRDNPIEARVSVEFDASINRLPKAVMKIVTAHARLHLRSVATVADVDFAMKYVKLKFDVLKDLSPSIRTRTLGASYLGAVATRRQWLQAQFAGKAFSLSDAHRKYSAKVSTCDERTIRRDLEACATPLGKGRWRFDNNVKNDRTDTSKNKYQKREARSSHDID